MSKIKIFSLGGLNEDGKNIYEYRGFGEKESVKIKTVIRRKIRLRITVF